MRNLKGKEVTIRNNSLSISEANYGIDPQMKEMRGNTYEVTNNSVGGVKVNSYWFSLDDVVIDEEVKDKPEQIVHFDETHLVI